MAVSEAIVESLTDDSGHVIYSCNIFTIQATGAKMQL